MNTTHLLIALVVGFLAGLHISTWGMYKDAIYEGFGWLRYFRSAVIGAIMGVIAYVIGRPDLGEPGQLMLFFGLAYVLERGVVEFWKTFVRTEDQSKYFIPMQFHVFGRVIESRAQRLAVGLPFALFVVVAFLAIHYLTRGSAWSPAWWAVFAIASVGGWISAVGGAWKDAPIEGFETLKFFRSPVLAGLYGLLLASFSTSLLFVSTAALGFTIATLETYKTFFFPSKPRGKFAGKPLRFPDMLERRKPFAALYIGIWILLIAGFVMAFAGPHRGLVDFS
jgi:hypothetical protein